MLGVLKTMKGILKTFGECVRGLRKGRGMSQEALAEKAGLHYTYIGGIERGERNPALKNIGKIAEALNVDAMELLSGPLTAEKSAIETRSKKEVAKRGSKRHLKESVEDYSGIEKRQLEKCAGYDHTDIWRAIHRLEEELRKKINGK